MVDLKEKRIEKMKKQSNYRDVEFPPCCLSCGNSKEHGDDTYCEYMEAVVDTFAICDEYKDSL